MAGAVDAFDGALHAGEGAGADQHTAVLVAAQFVGAQVGVLAFGARSGLDEVVHLALGHGEYLRRCVGAVHRPSRHIAHQGGYGVGVLQFRDALHCTAHKDEIADGGSAAVANAPVSALGVFAHRQEVLHAQPVQVLLHAQLPVVRDPHRIPAQRALGGLARGGGMRRRGIVCAPLPAGDSLDWVTSLRQMLASSGYVAASDGLWFAYVRRGDINVLVQAVDRACSGGGLLVCAVQDKSGGHR